MNQNFVNKLSKKSTFPNYFHWNENSLLKQKTFSKTLLFLDNSTDSRCGITIYKMTEKILESVRTTCD